MFNRILFLSLLCGFFFASCTNSPEPAVVDKSQNDNPEQLVLDSLEKLSDLIVDDPNNPNLYLKRASLYSSKNLFELAEDDLKRAISIDSTNSFMQAALGELYYSTGDLKNARLRYTRAGLLDETNTDAHLKLAEVFLKLNRYKESMASINTALRVNDQLYNGYFLKGFIYEIAGDTTLAKSSFQTSIELNPDFYEGYMSLGAMYAAEGNDLAVDYFNTALTIQPKSSEAMYNKGMFYQSTGQTDAALEVYQTMIDNNPKEFLGYYNSGYIYLTELSEYKTAQAYFDTVLTLVPNYPDALYNRGLCFEEMGDKDSAIQLYQRVMQVEPQHDLAVRGLDRLIR